MNRALLSKTLLKDALRDIVTQTEVYIPETYAGSVEPIRKPDLKAKKRPRPSFVRRVWPALVLAAGISSADAAVIRPTSPVMIMEAARALALEQICMANYGADARLEGMTIEAIIEAEEMVTEMLHEVSGEENDLCGVMAAVERR